MEKADLNKPMEAREKIFSAAAALLFLLPFLNLWWSPNQKELVKIRSNIRNQEMQAGAISKLIELTSGRLGMAGGKISAGEAEQVSQSPAGKWRLSNAVKFLTGKDILSGIGVQNFQIGEKKSDMVDSPVPIRMVLLGKYAAISRFVGKVEGTDMPFEIDSVSIAESDEKKGSLQASIIINFYATGDL